MQMKKKHMKTTKTSKHMKTATETMQQYTVQFVYALETQFNIMLNQLIIWALFIV